MILRRIAPVLLLMAAALFAPLSLSAQKKTPSDFEIFGGYSWYHPGGSVPLPPVGLPTIAPAAAVSDPDIGIGDYQKGWGGALTINLNNWLGITGEGSGHYEDGDAYTIAGGPRFKMHHGRLEPFAEILAGMSRFVPNALPDENHFALITGLGLDYRLNKHFAIRPIQADYVFTSYNAINPKSWNTLNGVRVQAGFVFNVGFHEPEAPPTASCSAEPSTVDAGGPVTVTVTPAGFPPKRTLSYSYTSTGGKVSGTGASASVDTTGLQGGNYTVSATVTDKGKRTASCQATFTVKQPQPPTLSVTANPDTVMSGEKSTITAQGNSPDNRPLTYGCNATAGTLSGSGTQYTLDTTGAPEGSIGVNCTVTDDRNLSASASTSVRVNVPPPPPPPPAPAPAPAAQPQANKFGAIEFKHDLKRPTRVDNEAKGELDRYADALAAAPDSRGVVVGQATKEEQAKPAGRKYAAQRAINTKAYLTQEKGIDPARIEVRAGSEDDQRTDLWIVPAGAQFPEADTVKVDEQQVKAVPRTAPAPARKKKAE